MNPTGKKATNLECSHDLSQFVFGDGLQLSVADAVAEEDDFLGQLLAIPLLPGFEGGDHAAFQPVCQLHMRVLASRTRVVPRQVSVGGRDESADRLTW